ncbi:MAG: hypothetical protein A2527_05045 [Candidatus Lambdaproteobacteria bacterium RIFOXYD2_FULL_50_16]|uniref:Uncharacterized protein n=1 Tax=Candidatus Lambdaproteobacteria bacterium RIFOXYD2_FULL_50_16 TaxID=1817772 RepID=A0A1F6G9U6_9PROT|nr:MAG: hypothetical protein A2527_05045 [Candidatus Lambdaproteobacteria bacterium RIFOXYD2_FULL_50_16]
MIKAKMDKVFWIAAFLTPLLPIVSYVIYKYGLWGIDIATKTRAERLGQFGDFFGGVLNPLLSALAFFALLYTISGQREELHEARKSRRSDSIATLIRQTDASLNQILFKDYSGHTIQGFCDKVSRDRLPPSKNGIGVVWPENLSVPTISNQVFNRINLGLELMAKLVQRYRKEIGEQEAKEYAEYCVITYETCFDTLKAIGPAYQYENINAMFWPDNHSPTSKKDANA